MITAPLWFRPWMLKAGGLAIITSLIFYAGCQQQKNMDQNKINKLKTEITTIEANYDQSLEMIARSEANYDVLHQMVQDSNAEVIRQGKEYNLKVMSIRKVSQVAIDNITRTHTTALSAANDQLNHLNERFLSLSASEACHESWLEVVK